MKIFAISDLHLSLTVNKPMDIFGGNWDNYWEKIKTDWAEKVTDGDVVLIAGDISWAMRMDEAAADLNEIAGLKGKKVIIRGNHEYWWSSYAKVKAILPKGVYAIQNDSLKFENAVIAGTRGWVIPDKTSDGETVKIYEREKIRLKMTLDAAVKQKSGGDGLYLMMHYPPFNPDVSPSGFTDIIEQYPVDCVVYGHIHGVKGARLVSEKNNIKYYLTSCDMIENKLIELPSK
ncbi:MAG: metallophosphoesterase [Clostridiales bacterium]|jgi:predicted phosphohydrolase|nr:metallophosphoesterase [Clostridiales bacterium]